MIYITGASGFVGSHLQKKIGAEAIPHRAIGQWPIGKGDTVFFLSSYGNIYGQDDIRLTVEANLLQAVDVAWRGARVIYASSSSVKMGVQNPFLHVAAGYQNPYMHAKRAAEEALLALGNNCICRLYTVLGIGDSPKHLVPTLIHSVLFGNQIDFYPWAAHDYIDVDDVVDAFVNLAPHDGIFEVGTGRSYTNAEVLAAVEKTTGGHVNYKLVSGMRPYDTIQWPSPNGSARAYGWEPKKDLWKSIEEMVSAAIKGEGVGA